MNEAAQQVEKQIAELRASITPLHVERGRQMRAIVQTDISRRGYSYEGAISALAAELNIDRETVVLAIAIANEADETTPEEEREERIDVYKIRPGYAAHVGPLFKRWLSHRELRAWAAENGYTVEKLRTPRTPTWSPVQTVTHELVRSAS